MKAVVRAGRLARPDLSDSSSLRAERLVAASAAKGAPADLTLRAPPL
jgi:hypothetical protein